MKAYVKGSASGHGHFVELENNNGEKRFLDMTGISDIQMISHVLDHGGRTIVNHFIRLGFRDRKEDIFMKQYVNIENAPDTFTQEDHDKYSAAQGAASRLFYAVFVGVAEQISAK